MAHFSTMTSTSNVSVSSSQPATATPSASKALLNPLALPEILSILGNYLDSTDLAIGLRVCKTWYTAFLPSVWCNVTLGYGWKPRVRQVLNCSMGKLDFGRGRPEIPLGPALETLLQQRHMIRQLSFKDAFPARYVLHYPRLHTLSIQHRGGYEEDVTKLLETDPTAMIELNPSVVNLAIDFGGYDLFWDALYKALSSLLHLRALDFRQAHIPEAWVRPFLQLFSRFEKLKLYRVKFAGPKSSEGITFPLMRELSMTDYCSFRPYDMVEFFSKCPRLEHLSWTMEWSGWAPTDQDEKVFASLVADNTWPHLKSLTLNVLSGAGLTSLLKELPPMENLNFRNSNFGPSAFQELRRHFETLKSLDIRHCSQVTDAMVGEILYTCTEMEDLRTPDVVAKDVIERPWSCQNLNKLEGRFKFLGDQDIRHEVFERFYGLKELEILKYID